MAARRIALLGGTTTFADCVIAAAFLARPHRLVNGPYIRRFEAAFADYVGVRHGYSFASGRVALYAILKGLGIGDGDDVVVQVPTHIVVANAISYTGARPVFIDSSAQTGNMDLAILKKAITDRTRAIIIQHTFGIPADLRAVLRLGRECKAEIIEDCVHALGSQYGAARVGSFGRASFFSTEETKTISTTMGGMAVTNDDDLAERVAKVQAQCDSPPAFLAWRYVAKLIAYHLLTEPHIHPYTRALYEAFGKRSPLPRPTRDEEARGDRPPGYLSLISNAQAALGLRQLSRVDVNIAHRRRIAAALRSRLDALGFEMPVPPPGAHPAYVRVPVYVRDRDVALRTAAPRAVLGTWFTSVLEEAAGPRAGGYVEGSCPVAEWLTQRLVNVPTHERVSLDDVDAIVAALVLARDNAGQPAVTLPAP